MLNRIYLLIVSLNLFALAGISQPGKIDSALFPMPVTHPMEEYAFDSPLDPSSWLKVPGGLNISFASTNEAYFRTEVPAIGNPIHNWNQTAWRGERINAMILVWSSDTLNQIRFELKDLKSSKGNSISKTNIRVSKVNYVVSNYPYGASDATCGTGSTRYGWLMPDRLEPMEGANDRFDLQGRTTRPVWLSVDIPASTIAGDYSGELEIRSDKESRTLQIKLHVQHLILPRPHDWKFRLDLWQNPWVIADYYHVKPWSADHKAILLRHLQLYADAGGKYITTYAVHSPWGDGEYYTEGGMIEWIKTANGKWKFDYRIFDEYVELAIKAGIDDAITLYTPLPYGERFRYKEESTGKYVYERWVPESDTFKYNWNSFLTDLRSHLLKKGWLQKAYLGVNENAMEQTLSAIRVIKAHSKSWRITYAGDWHDELDSLLDDYSCVYNKEPAVAAVKNRAARQKTSTYYICCTPPKPNTFVFSPPIEGRWLGWYTFAHGYDGMLRWAYDAWTSDPTRNPTHIYWPSGDCYMVYPGGNSSIRFEKMREGIVDFEKLRILNTLAKKSSSIAIKKLLAELNAHFQAFLEEKTFEPGKISKDVQMGLDLINELSEKPGI